MIGAIARYIPLKYAAPGMFLYEINKRVIFPAAGYVADKITGLTPEESAHQRKIVSEYLDPITNYIDKLENEIIEDILGYAISSGSGIFEYFMSDNNQNNNQNNQNEQIVEGIPIPEPEPRIPIRLPPPQPAPDLYPQTWKPMSIYDPNPNKIEPYQEYLLTPSESSKFIPIAKNKTAVKYDPNLYWAFTETNKPKFT